MANEFKAYAADGIALNPFARWKSFRESRTWHERTFDQALSVIWEAVESNKGNADAQWLLLYGHILAGRYSEVLKLLKIYPGISSEAVDQRSLAVRATFGVNGTAGVTSQKEFLAGLKDKCLIANLRLMNFASVPMSMVKEHIKVVDYLEISIKSVVIRAGEQACFENTLRFNESYISRFNEATVIPEYGMVVLEDQILIKDSAHVKLCHMGVFSSCLKEITDERALLCTAMPTCFEEENCIYLGVNNNFYHWLIEELPRLHIIERSKLFSESPILVDHTISEWQCKLLAMMGIERERLRKLDFLRPVRFKNLVVPSHLSRDMVAHPDAVSFMRSKLLGRSLDLKPKHGKRLYVGRRDHVETKRGMLNEKSVREKFRRSNFQIVDTGKLSIEEQIELFADAEVIAGPGGAALTNILFAPKQARVLSLGSSDILCETFTSIAAAIGQESWSVRGRSYPKAYPHWIWTNFDFEIDERDIDFCFERIL